MPGFPPPREKLLILRLSSFGDIIHSIPAQQELRRRHPDAAIHWLSEPAYVPFLNCVQGVDRVWPAATRRWRRSFAAPGEIARMVRALRRERFERVYDFQGLLKSALLSRLVGAREIVGFESSHLREPAAARFYSRRVGVTGENRHVIELNLRLAGAEDGGSPLISLRIPEQAEAYVEAQLERRTARNPVLINPGAGWVTKLWPARSYAQLGTLIETKLGLPVVYTYGPGEEPLVEEIAAALAPERPRTFPTGLLELAALCRRARLFVGGDTGPLHLAVALGTPSVAVLGPTTASRNGPFNGYDQVVQRRLPCSDCYKRTCNQFICMDISVEEVYEAVLRRLNP